MQGRQFPTTFRHFQSNRTPFLKILSGVRISHYFLSVSDLLVFGFSFGDPLGARTQDPNIKSVVLYLLS